GTCWSAPRTRYQARCAQQLLPCVFLLYGGSGLIVDCQQRRPASTHMGEGGTRKPRQGRGESPTVKTGLAGQCPSRGGAERLTYRKRLLKERRQRLPLLTRSRRHESRL